MISMKKYSKEEREKAIKEIETSPLNPEEWEGPHEAKVVSYKYIEDVTERRKKILLSGKSEKLVSHAT